MSSNTRSYAWSRILSFKDHDDFLAKLSSLLRCVGSFEAMSVLLGIPNARELLHKTALPSRKDYKRIMAMELPDKPGLPASDRELYEKLGDIVDSLNSISNSLDSLVEIMRQR